MISTVPKVSSRLIRSSVQPRRCRAGSISLTRVSASFISDICQQMMTVRVEQRHTGGVDIRANLETYLAARSPTDRYASFDYCFNYFQTRAEQGRLGELAGGPDLEVS